MGKKPFAFFDNMPPLSGMILPFLVVLGMAMNACTDPCKDKTCQNGGNCVEGNCLCPEGFIGPNCEIALDPCPRLNCDPVGTDSCQAISSDQAVCVCKTGFEGTRCEEPVNEKFFGDFDGTETCDAVSRVYPVVIEEGPVKSKQITIVNFFDFFGTAGPAKLVADVILSKGLEIYPQFMEFGQVTGGGVISDDGQRIDISFTVITSTDTSNCALVLLRK